MNTLNKCRATIRQLRPTVSATLWHYCARDSIKYLLKRDADLSCRYASFMDADPQEIRVGGRAYVEYLKAHSRYSGVANLIELDIKNNNEWQTKEIGPKVPLTFSFTEWPDSEYHWKEYAKNDGYAIAFSQERLDFACDEVMKKDGVALMLVPCFYMGKDKCEIDQIFNALTEDLHSALSILLNSKAYDPEKVRWAEIEVLLAIRHMSLGIKEEIFQNDKEWRLVMISPYNYGLYPDPGFRPTGLRHCCKNADLIDLMEGVAVTNAETLRELSQFALRQRKPDFRIWM